VTADPVVKDLDVIKETELGLLPVPIAYLINQFILQAGEEGFDAGVIPAVTLATHRTFDTVLCQKALIRETGVQTVAITVMQEPGLWLPPI